MMEFEHCHHSPVPIRGAQSLYIDDLQRWAVDITCTECNAHGYIIIGNQPKLIWDPMTLPEWRHVERDL